MPDEFENEDNDFGSNNELPPYGHRSLRPRVSGNGGSMDQGQTFAHLIKAMADQADTINKQTDHISGLEHEAARLRSLITELNKKLDTEKSKTAEDSSKLAEEQKSHLDTKEKLTKIEAKYEILDTEISRMRNKKGFFSRIFDAARDKSA